MLAKPVIPWMGGKRRLAPHILPLFGEHTCYVEPFAGDIQRAARFFYLQKLSFGSKVQGQTWRSWPVRSRAR